MLASDRLASGMVLPNAEGSDSIHLNFHESPMPFNQTLASCQEHFLSGPSLCCPEVFSPLQIACSSVTFSLLADTPCPLSRKATTESLEVHTPPKNTNMSQQGGAGAHNEWTSEQRFVLHLLHSQFDLGAQYQAAIFNHIFDGYLKEQGITDGLTAKILDSQYYERKRQGRSHLWAAVLATPKSDEETAKRQDLLERVRAAATTVGADLTVPSRASPTQVPVGKLSATNQQSTGGSRLKNWKGWAQATGDDVERLAAVRRQNGFDHPDLKTTIPRTRTGRPEPEQNTAGVSSNDTAAAAEVADVGSGPMQVNDAGVHEDDADDQNDEGHEGEEDEEGAEPEGEAGEGSDEEKPSQLDMIHMKDLTWTGSEPSWGWHESYLIDHESEVYKHGGQVHRIYDQEGHTDLMICDLTFCETCSPNADPNSESKTSGLPFVHASDTIRDLDGRMIFKPTPKVNSGNIPQCYWRGILFHSIDGGLTCEAIVCNYVRCTVCSGSETLRVMENKDLDWAEREAEEDSGQSADRKTAGRQAGEGSSSMFVFES